MSQTQFEDYRGSVTKIVESIRQSSPSEETLWRVAGPTGVGKCLFLYYLRSALGKKGMRTVLVGAPSKSFDAGPAALVQISSQLKSQGEEGVDLSALENRARRFKEKLQDVKQWVEKARERVVFLWDEPFEQLRLTRDDDRFSEVLSLVNHTLISQTAGLHVVTGFVPQFRERKETVHLQGLLDVHRMLRDDASWGTLATAAAAVEKQTRQSASNWSPAEVRMRVSLAALDQHVDYAASGRLAFADLAESLATLVTGDRRFASLRDTWARIALIRGQFSPGLAKLLGAETLGGMEAGVLWKGLLEDREGAFSMHKMLKSIAGTRQWLDDAGQRQTHRMLAEYYLRRAEQSVPQDPRRLLDRLEVFHHLAAVGEADATQASFGEQLDALGRSLSIARKYEPAVRVFEQAIAIDENDDYAHHYLAYNLDVQGKEPSLVEDHYRRAVELDPKNSWWRARLISFFITLGRERDARREWSETLDALNLPDEEAPSSLYEDLHLWVARLLLHRCQLEFARAVLDTVPCDLRDRHSGFRAIDRLLVAMQEARRARVVFPAWISASEWWSEPKLLEKRDLREWLAGRVEDMDPDGVHLVMAGPPSPKNAPASYGYVTISVMEFDRDSRDEGATQMRKGRFLEVGFYGERNERRIRVHPERGSPDRDLPGLGMNPQRYLLTEGFVR